MIPWLILTAALQESSSPESDEVAAIIGGGLEFECPLGEVKMVSRPDYDSPKTVQAIGDIYTKRLGGKLSRSTLEEAKILIEQWRKAYNQIRPHIALRYRPPAPEAIMPVIVPMGLT